MARAVKIFGGTLAVAMVALIVAYFALQRVDISYATLERRYANHASRFIDLPGEFHVHYRDQGNTSGPTLLLIHGFGSSLETWEPWVNLLRDRYRLISIDLPGHGLTRAQHFAGNIHANAELIVAFAREMRLQHIIIVGNSMGGAISWNLALHHSEFIDGLVLLDASGWEWSRKSSGAWLFKLIGSPALRNIDKTLLIRTSLLAAYFDKSRVTSAMVKRYVDLSRGPGHRQILDRTIVQTLGGEDADIKATEEKLHRIHMPALIVWGARDEVVEPADAQRFVRGIAHSTLVIYPNTGHIPMEEAALRSAADLDSWIARLQRSAVLK